MCLRKGLSSAYQVRRKGGGLTMSQITSQSVIFRSNCPETLSNSAKKIVSAYAFILSSVDVLFPELGLRGPDPQMQTCFLYMDEGSVAAPAAETVCHKSRRPADTRWWCRYILRLLSGGLRCITRKHELHEWNDAARKSEEREIADKFCY